MSGFSTRLEEVYIFQETRKSVPANQKVISIGYSLIRISLPWQFKVSFSWCIMIVVHQKSWCCRIYLFIYFFWLFRFGPFLWAALQSWKTLPVGSAFRVVEMTSSDFFKFFFLIDRNLADLTAPPLFPYWADEDLYPSISLWHSKTLYFPALLFIHLSFIFLIYFLTFNLPRPFILHTIIPPGTPKKSKCHCKDSSCAFPFKTHNLHTLCFLDFCFVCI